MAARRKRSRSAAGKKAARTKHANRIKQLTRNMKVQLTRYTNEGRNHYERFRDAKRELYTMISKRKAQAIIQSLVEDRDDWGEFAQRFSKLS